MWYPLLANVRWISEYLTVKIKVNDIGRMAKYCWANFCIILQKKNGGSGSDWVLPISLQTDLHYVKLIFISISFFIVLLYHMFIVWVYRTINKSIDVVSPLKSAGTVQKYKYGAQIVSLLFWTGVSILQSERQIDAYINAHTNIPKHTNTNHHHVPSQTQTITHTHTYAHTRTHTHIHTHMHMHTRAQIASVWLDDASKIWFRYVLQTLPSAARPTSLRHPSCERPSRRVIPFSFPAIHFAGSQLVCVNGRVVRHLAYKLLIAPIQHGLSGKSFQIHPLRSATVIRALLSTLDRRTPVMLDTCNHIQRP